jgi:hypothetical protein
MVDMLYIFAEVLLNYNLKPCIHYNKHFMPLYLTCKTFYNKFLSDNLQLFNCDICYFRKIICPNCQLNNKKSCDECICNRCNISGNLTGCLPHVGICDKCLILLSQNNVLAKPLLFGRLYKNDLPKIALQYHSVNIQINVNNGNIDTS